MTTLLVIGFFHRTTADAAAQDVLEAEPDLALGADAVAVVSRDDDGVFHVTTNHRPGRDERRSFWYLLLEALIFLPGSPLLNDADAQDLASHLARLGMDEAFQDRLRELVAPHCSALFVLVDDGLSIDALPSLGRFGGRLLTATLVPDVEARIVQALPGTTPDDPSPDAPDAGPRAPGPARQPRPTETPDSRRTTRRG